MPFVEKRLSGPTQLTTAAQAIYTVPAGGQSAVIRQIVVTNISASAATFTLYIGAESAANALFSASSVAANDTVIINLSQVLATGEVVRAKASANSSINVTISGVENDGPIAQGTTYIAEGSITTSKIADGSVTTSKIADSAVITQDIANNAVTQTKLSTDIPLSGMRNKIINGGFDIWQRGTPFSSAGYTADRWIILADGSGATRSISRESFTLGNAISGQESPFFLRYNQTIAGTSATFNIIEQRIEDVRTCAGQPVTVSFWAKADSSRTMTTQVQQNFGSGGSAEVQAVATQNIALNTSWQKFTYTFTMPSIANKTIGTSSYVAFRINMPNNATFTFDLWGVQLEQSAQVTPFEQRPFSVELNLCQRYYEVNTYTILSSYMVNGANYYQSNRFRVPKRDASSNISLTNISNVGCNTPLTNGIFVDAFLVYVTATSTVSTGYAEYRWVAEREL